MPDPHYLIFLDVPREDNHFLGCAKGGWSTWVCPKEDVVILLDVPREGWSLP